MHHRKWHRVGGLLLVFFLLSSSRDQLRAAETPAIADRFPGAEWERTSPEQAGWSAKGLADAQAWWATIEPTAAVMIVQHGRVVWEWGDTVTKSNLHSIRKSLLSALIGIAVSEHKIDLSATLESLGIDDNAPGLTATEKTATVGDLLKARSGIYHAALYETPGMARLRPPRGSHPPGTFWYYNNWDFNALGSIYEHTTGEWIFNAFAQKIATPIGMQDYKASDGEYFRGPASEHPAYPIRMSARDLARFALLYLHDGRWSDRQIVPAAWVHDSTRAYSEAFSGIGPGLGYGYLWWTGFMSNAGAPIVKVPEGTYWAWGAEGQYAFVIPALDLVVVHRINSDASIGDGPGERKAEPNTRELGRLLWLILTAAGDADAGPDVSLAHADGSRLSGEALHAALSGASLEVGAEIKGGPFHWHLDPDGKLTVLNQGETVVFTGRWRIDGDRYCRNLVSARPQDACFTAIAKDNRIAFFDSDGLMAFDTTLDHP